MRLLHYINESVIQEIDSVDDFNELMHKNCKPYLKLIQGKDHPLYRGMSSYHGWMGEKKVRQDRIPKGMGSYQAALLNTWLKSKGHVRRDKAVMASSSSHVRIHGDRYFIFPIGKFDYTWIRANDINIDDPLTGWYQGAVQDAIEYGFDDMKDYKRLPKEFDEYFYTNKGFNIAYEEGYEIWMNPKSYYFAREGRFEWDRYAKEIISSERIN